jgi:hypothetical protein
MHISMPQLDRAFAKVRSELTELGLLAEGKYLDRIDLMRAALPAITTMGYVFHDGVGWFTRLIGFREGVIYVPSVAPVQPRTPGLTLVDVVRHEFAHAWAWHDPKRVNGPWFRRTFGARYGKDWPEGEPEFDADAFVSEYATTSPAEDFAETFMTFLRCRRSLHRFRTHRRLHRKLAAVAAQVRRTAAELRLQ